MDGHDPAASEQEIELRRFDLPLSLASQRVDRQIDVIFERLYFGSLVLVDDVLDRQMMDREIFF